jgi:hypothetical protein
MAAPDSRLSPLQVRILGELAGMKPPWTLTGGGALVGFHLGHRTTRDLDLFWRDKVTLISSTHEVIERLRKLGLQVESVQSSPMFQRLNVRDGHEACVIDLIIEPVPAIEAPITHELAGRKIMVDTAHEILVDKLCALLGRSEFRDLVDVRALLDSGGDLERALSDAHKKDAGFSPLTLAWTVKHLPVESLTRDLKLRENEIEEWVRYREALGEKVLSLSAG